MTPTQCGAFCNTCQKEVVDFSQMSEAEIVDRLSKASGNVCGRIKTDKLDRELVKFEPDPQWYSWKKWAVAAGVLLGVINAHAEDGNKKDTTTVVIVKDTIIKMLPELMVVESVPNPITCAPQSTYVTTGLVNVGYKPPNPKRMTKRQRAKLFFLRVQRAFLKPKYR